MSPVSRRGGGGGQGTWPRLVKSSILRTSKVAARGEAWASGREACLRWITWRGRVGVASVCFRWLSEYGRAIVLKED